MPQSNSRPSSHERNNETVVLLGFIRLFLGIYDRNTFIRTVQSSRINLKDFMSQVRLHKAQEIIHHTITSYQLKKILPRLAERLDNIIKARQRHNEELWSEFTVLSNKLKKENIPYVLYKGITFAKLFYPSLLLRRSVDIDLGLKLTDIAAAAPLIKSCGFEDHKGHVDYDKLDKSRAYYIDFSYVKKDAQDKIKYNIEYHWTAAHHVLHVPYFFEDVIDKRIEIDINGKVVTSVSKIEQVVLMVIHHGLVDVWGKLRHLIDLHFVLQNLNEEESQQLHTRLADLGLTKCFAIGKQLLAVLYDKEEGDQLWIHILEGNMSKNWSEFPRKFWWHLKLRDSSLDRVKVMYSMLLFRLKFGKTKD